MHHRYYAKADQGPPTANPTQEGTRRESPVTPTVRSDARLRPQCLRVYRCLEQMKDRNTEGSLHVSESLNVLNREAATDDEGLNVVLSDR